MLDWYFSKTSTKIWLGTEQKSKAEIFYKKRGWIEVGIHGKNETKFEMTFAEWEKQNTNLDFL